MYCLFDQLEMMFFPKSPTHAHW